MRNLTLTLVQCDLQWQDAAGNLAHLEALLAGLDRPTDLIILPETFTSAFCTDAGALAEHWPGETPDWMRAMAARHDAALCGSIAVIEDGRRYNRLLFATPDGTVRHYDKRHLFRMMGEHERYSAGSDKLILEWRGWRIMPLVCYDLRFPVWSRYTPAEPYDLLLYVANWPAPRTGHWSSLLAARAIENQCCVAGVNRIGVDGRGIAYDGHSAVHDAQGQYLLQAQRQAGLHHAVLDGRELLNYRERFPAHLDADEFVIASARAPQSEP